MKAVTVAGGSSDDPKIEGTTVAGADPDDTSTDPEAGAGAVPEDRAGRPERGPESQSSPGSEAGEGEPEAEAEDDGAATPAEEPEPESESDSGATDPEEETPEEAEPEGPTSKDTAGASRSTDAEGETPARTDEPDDADADDETPAGADEPDGADAEAEAPQGDDATRMLKMPPRSTETSDDAGTRTPEAQAADAPASTEDAEDEAPEASDATRVLKVPARTPAAPGGAGPEGPTPTPKAPAEADAEGEAPEGDDATRMLKMPPRTTATPDDAGTQTPEAKAADAGDGAPEAPDTTRVLKMPPPGAAEPKAAEPKEEPGSGAGRADAGKEDDRGTGGPRVPGWAKARAEDKTSADTGTDPERTSRFVALKDLDVPPPAPTRPQSQPQAPAPTPLPPLDLLAELTNTPAPPETPRRTALRRVKVWTPILLLLVGACIGGQMLRPLPDPRLVAAEAEHTVDGQLSIPWPGMGQGAVRVVGSGDIGTFGEQKPVPTASVAKIMTAYVILKGHPLRRTEPGPDITVDAKTVADGNSEHESRITGLTAGSKFSQQDMLKMLMIPSGNNVARLLARWDTGTDSEAAFVEKMNAAARELGMKNTTYTDPSGLDAGTVSTAADQLKLAEAVMKDDAFRAIVALPEASIKGLGEKLVNNNHLLTDSGLSIRGIKTGSSTPAGGTFVWAAYKRVGDKDQLILGSLMEQRAPAPDQDALNSLALVKTNSKKIIESMRTALASTPLVRKGDVVGHVDDGLGGRVPLVAVKDLNVISVPGQRFKLSLTAGPSALPHTAKTGTEVAVLTAGEGEGAKSVPVAVQGALAEPSFGTRLTRIG